MRTKSNPERVRFYRKHLFYLMKHEDGYHVDMEGCGESDYPAGKTIKEALLHAKAHIDYEITMEREEVK
jgi:hypothetical protein